MTTGKHVRAQADVRQSKLDREALIAYLQYAVEDVAAVSETGATLLRMAIAHLAVSEAQAPAADREPKRA